MHNNPSMGVVRNITFGASNEIQKRVYEVEHNKKFHQIVKLYEETDMNKVLSESDDKVNFGCKIPILYDFIDEMYIVIAHPRIKDSTDIYKFAKINIYIQEEHHLFCRVIQEFK